MDRRVTKTKQAIQNAYLELLKEKKRGRITISEIARSANIDRKTFYLHYECVEDIIREFCRNKVDELVASLKTEDIPTQEFSVARVFEMLNQIVEENMELFQLISARRDYDYFFDEVKKLVVEIIVEKGQEYFGYPAGELELYAEFFIAGIISAYVRWLREGMAIPLDELAELVSGAAFGGLEKLLPVTEGES